MSKMHCCRLVIYMEFDGLNGGLSGEGGVVDVGKALRVHSSLHSNNLSTNQNRIA